MRQAHAYIIGQLKLDGGSKWWFGKKEDKKKDLIHNLDKVFDKIQHQHRGTISMGDFPDITVMTSVLREHDFTKFNHLNLKLVNSVNNMLEEELPKLIAMIPEDQGSDSLTNPLQYRSNL